MTTPQERQTEYELRARSIAEKAYMAHLAIGNSAYDLIKRIVELESRNGGRERTNNMTKAFMVIRADTEAFNHHMEVYDKLVQNMNQPVGG